MQLAPVADAAAIGFEVVDVLGGLARLVKRSPTLDGSVPVRVAQGCAPLLEGNAWGYQVVLREPIALRRRLGRWAAEVPEAVERELRAVLPVLVADGTVRGAWAERLARGVVDTRGGLSVFTGLFARPRPGYRLRQASTANRRARTYTVGEAILDDPGGLCPIVLALTPAVDALALVGEVATLALLPAALAIHRLALGDPAADAIARAHLAFYDEAYFAAKQRGQVVRKYRDAIAGAARGEPGAPIAVTVVDAGPALVEPGAATIAHRADGPVAAAGAADRLVVTNAVDLTARYDGATVAVAPDLAQLAAYARAVRATWERWLGGPPAHPGALLYLTKYVTPHPPGEPHFFVKPPALIRTPPGVSTAIDGERAATHDVLRGVVHTDAFHAIPAVLALHGDAPIELARGAPLATLWPGARALDGLGFTQEARPVWR